MARDRKRAKQRRDRARRAPNATAERRPRGRPSGDLPPADALEPDQTLDDHRAALSRAEAEDTHNAPDPLDHASAEVDLAHARIEQDAAAADVEVDDARVRMADEDELDEDDPELDEEAIEAAPPAAIPRDERSAVTQQGGNRVAAFLAASWRELQRVQWPDRRQVTQATGVVVAFVIVAGAFLGLADLVFNRLVDLIL